jgi:hypothetical protein
LNEGQAKVSYNKLKQSESTEANISLWESDIVDGEGETAIRYPIVTPEYNQGLVRGVVTKYQTAGNKYISLDYIYWPIDITQFATYPIISVKDAYEKLQNGEGVTVLPYSQSTISIEKVYLAYLLPQDYIPYLQPIYVFQGPNFVAYVQAITSDNIEP